MGILKLLLGLVTGGGSHEIQIEQDLPRGSEPGKQQGFCLWSGDWTQIKAISTVSITAVVFVHIPVRPDDPPTAACAACLMVQLTFRFAD